VIPLGASNFDALFEGDNVRDDVVRDVIEAFAEDDRAEQAKAGHARNVAGYFNQNVPHTWSDIGVPTMRLTVDDFWRQQVAHNAVGDPDLWHWFLRRPEGEYARVKSSSPRIVVGFTGGKRETIRFKP